MTAGLGALRIYRQVTEDNIDPFEVFAGLDADVPVFAESTS